MSKAWTATSLEREAVAQTPDQRERELLGRLRLTLPRLDALLRAEQFVIGPDCWQNAYDLLLALQARGRLPARAAELRPLLAPLFCRSADEQARFDQVFQCWLEELVQSPETGGQGAEPLVEQFTLL